MKMSTNCYSTSNFLQQFGNPYLLGLAFVIQKSVWIPDRQTVFRFVLSDAKLVYFHIYHVHRYCHGQNQLFCQNNEFCFGNFYWLDILQNILIRHRWVRIWKLFVNLTFRSSFSSFIPIKPYFFHFLYRINESKVNYF